MHIFSKGAGEKEMWCVSRYREMFTCREPQAGGELVGRSQRGHAMVFLFEFLYIMCLDLKRKSALDHL